MTEATSARAQWNVWVFMTILLTVFLMALTIWGLAEGKVAWELALATWAGPASAGGLAAMLRGQVVP